MRNTAGSAAAPAARCRNLRRGSFIGCLSKMQRRDASLRLDVGRPDHLRPLDGIRLDDDSKLLRRIEGRLLNKIPATYPFRDFPEYGGLMSYGASLRDAIR